jgi:hypothetical protein
MLGPKSWCAMALVIALLLALAILGLKLNAFGHDAGQCLRSMCGHVPNGRRTTSGRGGDSNSNDAVCDDEKPSTS